MSKFKKMLRFFSSTSDDLLLLPSLLGVSLALGVLTIRHLALSEFGFPMYFLSCLSVIGVTLIFAVSVDARRMQWSHKDGGVIHSGRFFASFSVGILFAGEALYLAVIQNREPNLNISSSHPQTSPILLCLLSTTAAIICLWSGGLSQPSFDQKKIDDPSPPSPGNIPSSPQRGPLLKEWRIQQRAALAAALLVAIASPFLHLSPTPDQTDMSSLFAHQFFSPKGRTDIASVFLFAVLFFSIFGMFTRLLVLTTHG